MKKELFPWEDRERLGFFPALGASLQAIILAPSASFQKITADGPFWPPFLFGGLCLTIGTMAGQIWAFAARSLLGPVFDSQLRNWLSQVSGLNIPGADPAGQIGAIVKLLGGLIFAPIGAAISILISTCVYHVVLMLLRAPRKTFETTFAAVCYGSGSAAVLLLVPVPILASFLAGILGLVYTGIGITKMHGTTGGQAALVILIPILVCCCLAGVAVVSFGGLVAILAAMGAKT